MALHGKLEYYTDIMRTLFLELLEQYVVAKNPKLMLRRCTWAGPQAGRPQGLVAGGTEAYWAPRSRQVPASSGGGGQPRGDVPGSKHKAGL